MQESTSHGEPEHDAADMERSSMTDWLAFRDYAIICGIIEAESQRAVSDAVYELVGWDSVIEQECFKEEFR